MSKVLSVAWSEYLVAVRSKAFVIGVLFMPIMMGGAIFIPMLLEGASDVGDRHVAIVDGTGELFSVLEEAVEERNRNEIFDDDDPEKQLEPRFVLERYTPEEGGDDSVQLTLSDRVREGELFAFVEVGSGALEGTGDSSVRYFTQTPTYEDLPRWLRNVVNEHARDVRFEAAELDQGLVAQLNRPVPFEELGLASRGKSGEVIEAEHENELLTFGVPFASMMLMFMLVMSVAPAGLNNVLEEKMQKISEVLLSSVSPFQLMLGKLVGTVFVAWTLSLLYIGAAIFLLDYYGFLGMVPLSIFGWFILFQLLALMIFGSVFTAIGAACSEMRDAQSLMTPAMFLIIMPMMMMQPVMDAPDSTLAVASSLFPPATPFLMLVRIAIPPGPPLWQIGLAVFLTTGFSLLSVWAGGKIFRVGLLSQGQAPSFAKLAKWVLSK